MHTVICLLEQNSAKILEGGEKKTVASKIIAASLVFVCLHCNKNESLVLKGNERVAILFKNIKFSMVYANG